MADKAYRLIKNMFVSDQLVGGQKLRYQDLAQRMAMSQTPVIQALNRLELEGLVWSETNKGFFVAELGVSEAGELYDLRALLEVHLAPITAQKLSRDGGALAELERLRREHAEARSAVYRRERLMCDARFHLGLAEASGHKAATQTLRRSFDSLFLKCSLASLTPQRLATAEREHVLILDALKKGDGQQAARLLARHIANGREHILESVQRQWLASHPAPEEMESGET